MTGSGSRGGVFAINGLARATNGAGLSSAVIVSAALWAAQFAAVVAQLALDDVGHAYLLWRGLAQLVGVGLGFVASLMLLRGAAQFERRGPVLRIVALTAASTLPAILLLILLRMLVNPVTHMALSRLIGTIRPPEHPQVDSSVRFALIFLACLLAGGRLNRPLADGGEQASPEAMWLPTRTGARRVQIADILFLRAEGDYVRIRRVDGGEHLMRATLRRLEASLSPGGLVRVHRSILVNPRFIQAIEKRAGRAALLIIGGDWLPVGRKHLSALHAIRESTHL